jgi:hypothetical protein
MIGERTPGSGRERRDHVPHERAPLGRYALALAGITGPAGNALALAGNVGPVGNALALAARAPDAPRAITALARTVRILDVAMMDMLVLPCWVDVVEHYGWSRPSVRERVAGGH